MSRLVRAYAWIAIAVGTVIVLRAVPPVKPVIPSYDPVGGVFPAGPPAYEDDVRDVAMHQALSIPRVKTAIGPDGFDVLAVGAYVGGSRRGSPCNARPDDCAVVHIALQERRVVFDVVFRRSTQELVHLDEHVTEPGGLTAEQASRAHALAEDADPALRALAALPHEHPSGGPYAAWRISSPEAPCDIHLCAAVFLFVQPGPRARVVIDMDTNSIVGTHISLRY